MLTFNTAHFASLKVKDNLDFISIKSEASIKSDVSSIEVFSQGGKDSHKKTKNRRVGDDEGPPFKEGCKNDASAEERGAPEASHEITAHGISEMLCSNTEDTLTKVQI